MVMYVIGCIVAYTLTKSHEDKKLTWDDVAFRTMLSWGTVTIELFAILYAIGKTIEEK